MYTAKTKVEKRRLWTCPKCKHKFERQGQSHSCRAFPLAQHFENKPELKISALKIMDRRSARQESSKHSKV
jgi:hypothetical protein